MDNYMDSTSPEYVRRMASSLNAKWEALAPYVSPGVRVLDYGCGMPIEGGIRERAESLSRMSCCGDVHVSLVVTGPDGRNHHTDRQVAQFAYSMAWLVSRKGL